MHVSAARILRNVALVNPRDCSPPASSNGNELALRRRKRRLPVLGVSIELPVAERPISSAEVPAVSLEVDYQLAVFSGREGELRVLGKQGH